MAAKPIAALALLALLAHGAAAVAADPQCSTPDGCDADGSDSSMLQLQKQRGNTAAAEAKAEAAACAGEGSSCPYHVDWVVVGGGGAGCAAAHALALAGHEVTVLERGPSDRELSMKSTRAMVGWPASVADAAQNIRWSDGVWGAVGKVLGGGTSLNGGLYFALTKGWFKRNMPKVSWSRIKQSYQYLQGQLANPADPTAFGLAWNTALTEGGYGEADLSDPSVRWQRRKPFVPYSTFNQSVPGGPRYGSAALLHELDGLKNLHVMTDSEVQRINFDGDLATSVDVNRNGMRRTVHAKKGIILSAGAVFTPQLLQISGVGPKDLLKNLGVEVVKDVPGVGQNFIDRLVVSIGYPSSEELKLTVGYTVEVDMGNRSVIEGVGGGKIATELGVVSLGFVSPEDRTEEMRSILSKLFDSLPREELMAVNKMIQPVALQTNTHSRGTVEAISKSASDPPNVTANYFADPRDMENQKIRYKQLQALSNTPAMTNYTRVRKPVAPTLVRIIEKKYPLLADALSCLARSAKDDEYIKITFPCSPHPWKSDDALEAYLRKYIISSYHYFGTAAVDSVVTGRDFAVKGVRGLHVVDASVIPNPTTVNPQATIMALGYYLGKLLAEETP